MDSNNNSNDDNKSSAAGRQLQTHRARVAWVEDSLKFYWTDEDIESINQALEGLYRSRTLISATSLALRLNRNKPSEDTQMDTYLEDLAMAATRNVETFDTLEQMESQEFYETAKLPRSLLVKHGLTDYIKAAEKSEKSNAGCLLDWLTQLQEPPAKNDPNVYVCLIASSGTGKTQLAATASLAYNKATAIYLNMGHGETQRFYRPHTSGFGAKTFKKAISNFMSGPHPMTDAHDIAAWAESHSDEGNCLLVRMLYHLLTDESFIMPNGKPNTCMKLEDLKKSIKGKKYLVFIDEVPRKNHPEFKVSLCLRDIFRYLDIAPILMSTHTGAQDYVWSCSRFSIDTWTWVVSALPRYAPFPESHHNILVETERPLVLAFARKRLSQSSTLRDIVGALQHELQDRKPEAWTGSPGLQLVQLFCTDVEIKGQTFTSTHKVVGHHFGCLLQKAEDGRQKYNCLDAKHFDRDLAVAPVCAATEPLLYLALTTWNEETLWDKANTGIKFPLIDAQKQAVTVREAFESCKDNFTANASTENPKAAKMDGNLLEVLVHASLMLASMKVSPENNKFLCGVNLKDFLPFVRRLMLSGPLLRQPAFPDFFNKLDFDWPVVPALCGSNSGLPEGFAQANAINLGCLERPEDSAMVDGIISITPHDASDKIPLISIDCKNYSGGVAAKELKNVFQRIKSGITCSLVFVSAAQDNIFTKISLEGLKKECFSKNHDADCVSVVLWDKDKEPRFLQAKGANFAAKKETKLLVVIICVGVVNASISRKKRRLSLACANAY